MTLTPVDPIETRDLLARGARLIDIRDADEHARFHIATAQNVPLARLDDVVLQGPSPVIFHCRTGNRTHANAARLSQAAGGPAFVLEGGIDAWRAAGLPITEDHRQPIELMRQVQIAAGALVMTGVLLGLFVAPGFLGLAAFVGAGLIFAGTTGWCGMARMLALMPWNRRAAG